MSDSDDSSLNDIAICKEIDKLIILWEDITIHNHNTIDILESVRHMITQQDSMILFMDNEEYEFETHIEKLHSQILDTIKQGNQIFFSRTLIDILDKCSIKC